MEIIGVIDMRGGRAVHAVAGQRDRYAPIVDAAGVRVDGDPVVLARVYVEHLGIRELYVADLDAIVDRRPLTTAVADIVAVGAPTYVDAGARSIADAQEVIAGGARTVIVALETLPSWAALGEIIRAIGSDRMAFSVDLRHGTPLCPGGTDVTEASPEHVAARAADLGARTVLVIDLARVGGGAGIDLEMLRRVRAAVPEVQLLAGGGVRGAADLDALALAGCDAALVATALHDGRIGAADVYRSVSR